MQSSLIQDRNQCDMGKIFKVMGQSNGISSYAVEGSSWDISQYFHTEKLTVVAKNQEQ